MSSSKDNPGNSERCMRLEALVASPPTAKCKNILSLMEGFVAKHPGKLKLDIYYAGMQLAIKPTRGYQVEGKLKKVPSVFINGICVANGDVPDADETETVLESELAKGPSFWES